MRKSMILVVAAPLALGACEGMSREETIGGLGGAAVGGLAGSQVGSGSGQLIATGIGAVLGGLLGTELGRRMAPEDQQQAALAMDEAGTAPVGETITWSNPDSGNRGTVTPVAEGQTQDGRYCRQYQTTVYIDGEYEDASGTACQNADGSWEMVS